MSDDFRLSRRAFAGGALLSGAGRKRLRGPQGFAGLGMNGEGFAPVVPGKKLVFPADHGPHPDFRIEWWYVTANLTDPAGSGLWRAMDVVPPGHVSRRAAEGWANQQIWMGHAAVTRADTHRFSETFARGGVGQAGVEATPFHAWIDAWQMRGRDGDEQRHHFAARTQRRGNRFRLRATPRSRSRPGLAGRGRLQRQVRTGTGVLLLQPALFQGDRPHHHRRQDRSKSRDKPGWIANGAASRWPPIKPGGTGCHCIAMAARNSCCFGCAGPTAIPLFPANGSRRMVMAGRSLLPRSS